MQRAEKHYGSTIRVSSPGEQVLSSNEFKNAVNTGDDSGRSHKFTNTDIDLAAISLSVTTRVTSRSQRSCYFATVVSVWPNSASVVYEAAFPSPLAIRPTIDFAADGSGGAPFE
jgi:hypothetical protein